MKAIPIHVIVAGSAWISRLITGAVSLVNIRLLLKALGEEGYARYALLAGLFGWFALVDMGIGNALQNAISERRAKEEDYGPLLLSAALALLVLLLVLGLLAYPLSIFAGPWILRKLSVEASQASLDFLTIAWIYIGTIVGTVGYKVWFAQQRGYLANIAPAIASLTALGLLAGFEGAAWQKEVHYCLLAALGPACALALFALISVVFSQARKKLTFDTAGLKKLTRRSLGFWIVAAVAAFSLHADYLVMSQYLEADQVLTYNLPTRFFDTAKVFYAAILLALWPTWTELNAKKQWDKVLRFVKKYVAIGVGGAACFGVVMAFMMPYAIGFFASGKNLQVPTSFVLLLGAFEMVRTWTNTFAMVLMSMSKLRALAISIAFQSILTISFQVLLVPRIGIYGVTIGIMGAFLCTSAWVCPYLAFRYIRQEQANA